MKNLVSVVAKSTNYNVYIDKNNFKDIVKLIDEYKLNKNVFAVIDKGVYKHHKDLITKTLGKLDRFEFLLFDSKEQNKTIESILKIYEVILKKKFTRDSTFIAIGGGVVGDLFGFVAATFMRGVNYIQVPTTVLACVDSSVGGKTGFNFNDYKNIIGSIFQPAFVLIDTNFLTTLPQNQVVNGIGEIVKTCFLIGEEQLNKFASNFNKLIALDNKIITEFIVECVKFKAGVVTTDEKETLGYRKILNLGHTFAHAIEKETNFKIPHGEAVIVGVVCSLYLSYELKLISDDFLINSLAILNNLYPYIKLCPFNVNKAYESMKQDKKNKGNIIRFVLVNDYGKTGVDIEADKADVIFALNQGIEFFNKGKK